MEKEKPRLSRLAALLTQLQSKRIVTAREMAEKHQVSIRTIYRDIRTLEESGIPVFTEEGKGYSIMENYSIPPVMFTEEEANALITAEQIIDQNSDVSFIKQHQSAIEKIKSVLKFSQKEKSELLSKRIQIRNNHEHQSSSNYLIQLQSAITDYKNVWIQYLSLSNESSERKIEPFAIYHTQGNWILIAFCRLRKEFRAFRLDCIQKMMLLSSTFEPHPITLQQYFEICKAKSTPDIGLTIENYNFARNQKLNKMQTTKINGFQIIGIKTRTQNHGDDAANAIGALWQNFLQNGLQAKIPNIVSQEIYSIYTNYEGDYTQPYDVILGCKVNSLDNIPEGMVGQTFEGGTYTKTIAKGDINKGSVYNAWKEIWEANWKRTYTTDFERYGEKAMNPEDAEVDIFIAVED